MSLVINLDYNYDLTLFSQQRAMSTALEYAQASEKGTIVDGKKISLQVYRDDLDNVVNIEQIVQELFTLAEEYKQILELKPTSDGVIKTPQATNSVQFGAIQLIYSFVTTILQLVTIMITSKEDTLKNSTKSTLLNVVMLNIITTTRKFSPQIHKFIGLYSKNPIIVNSYLTFIGIPTNIYILFLMTMTTATLNFRSLLSTMFFFTLTGFLVFLFMPLILMLISTVIFSALSISIASMSINQFKVTLRKNVPIRPLLTYIADRIPPSVGRVEVTHKQQGK